MYVCMRCSAQWAHAGRLLYFVQGKAAVNNGYKLPSSASVREKLVTREKSSRACMVDRFSARRILYIPIYRARVCVCCCTFSLSLSGVLLRYIGKSVLVLRSSRFCVAHAREVLFIYQNARKDTPNKRAVEIKA